MDYFQKQLAKEIEEDYKREIVNEFLWDEYEKEQMEEELNESNSDSKQESLVDDDICFNELPEQEDLIAVNWVD